MWALRYKPLHQEDPPRLRLLILSRNLTRDRSWDISLILDGVGTKSPQAVNRPLSDFVRGLPDLAVAGLPDGTRALTDGLAEDLRRVKWTLPEPRSEEHTSELQSLMRISYAVFCLKKKNQTKSRKRRRD